MQGKIDYIDIFACVFSLLRCIDWPVAVRAKEKKVIQLQTFVAFRIN
jgi:hypothetical protein